MAVRDDGSHGKADIQKLITASSSMSKIPRKGNKEIIIFGVETITMPVSMIQQYRPNLCYSLNRGHISLTKTRNDFL
jgi:hypothetical protein